MMIDSIDDRMVYSHDGYGSSTCGKKKLKTVHRTAVDGTVPSGSAPTLSEQNTLYKDSTLYVGDLEVESGTMERYHFGNGFMYLPQGHLYAYGYYAQDHLGNIRHVAMSFLGGQNSIVQTSNYYPFGGLLNDVQDRTNVQKRLYNGKEYDSMHGLNLYDYSARQYDPAICQFTSMDLFCEKYYHINPYAYCVGNPVNAIDIHGDSITIISKKETFLYTPGITYNGKNKFIDNVCKDLNILSEKGGRDLLVELSQSNKTFRFKKSLGNTGFSADYQPDAGRALIRKPNSIPQQRVGCGGTIYVNYNQEFGYPTEYGNHDMVGRDNWYIVLGHECMHASNANNGLMNSQQYSPNHPDSNLRRVSKDEQSAMTYENYLRQKNGLPLRTAYSMYQENYFFSVISNVSKLPYTP